MKLNNRQLIVKDKVEHIAKLFGISPEWAVAVAMTESSLGEKQRSPTGCVGVFQMSSIAMKDLLQAMPEMDDDLVDICCGIAFLRLLLKRHGSESAAISHFCDPKDVGFYLDRVENFKKTLYGE